MHAYVRGRSPNGKVWLTITSPPDRAGEERTLSGDTAPAQGRIGPKAARGASALSYPADFASRTASPRFEFPSRNDRLEISPDRGPV